jgi:hypothetical protein
MALFVGVRHHPEICRITPFHGGNRGSNPLGDAKYFNWLIHYRSDRPSGIRQIYGIGAPGRGWTDADDGAKAEQRRGPVGSLSVNASGSACGLSPEVAATDAPPDPGTAGVLEASHSGFVMRCRLSRHVPRRIVSFRKSGTSWPSCRRFIPPSPTL